MLNRSIAPIFHSTNPITLPKVDITNFRSDIQLFSLSNSNLDVFRLEIVFKAGSYFGQKFGLSYFTSKLMPLGTTKRNAQQIAESFERLGGFLEVGQNQERLIVTLHGLTKYFGAYLTDLYDLIFLPSFPLDELEIQKKIASQSYLVSMEKTAVEANKIFREGLFGTEHSFGKTLQPSEIDFISVEELIGFHEKNIQHSNFNIFLTGNISKQEIDVLEGVFGHEVSVTSGLSIQSPKVLALFEQIIDKPDSVQSSIRIGRRMFNRHHPDFFKFLVFNTIFGGFFGSRLMKNIREEKGLTYGISSSMVPLADGGFWSIGADVKKENVPMALEEIQKEMDVLKLSPVTNNELNLVKNYIKGSVLSSTNTVFDVMDKHKAIVHEQLPVDFYDTMFNKIEAISVLDVQEMANMYMVDLSTVVVG